jgi:putative ABC transport system permease protein
VSNFWRDLKYGLRMLARNKGFAAVAILALAIGIGPNVAMFSVIWATFLAPLPYPNGDRLVVVRLLVKGQRSPSPSSDYLQYVAQSKSFEHLDLSAWQQLHMNSSDPSEEDITGGMVTPGFFSKTLGIDMLMGRDFLPEEGVPGNDHVVMITSMLWHQHFNSDPNIIGKQVQIEHQPYTIVAVRKPYAVETATFAVPLALTPDLRTSHYGDIMGRLKPGVMIVQAQAELSVINQRLGVNRRSAFPASAFSISVEPFKNDWLDKKLERNLWLLFASVGFVLLIACANVANLLLARGTSRQREIAVRSALGATRKQVFVQLLIESATLSILGGLVGIALGWALMKFIVFMLPDLALQAIETVIQINISVLLFALCIAMLSGILFGCAPAWHAAKLNLSEMLKHGSQSVVGGKKMRTQAILVVTEYALAITLLAGAGMALHSFWKLSRVDLGIRIDHIITAPLQLPRKDFTDLEQTKADAQRIMDKLQSLPGVRSVALSTTIPLDDHASFPFNIAGHPALPINQQPVADFQSVTPGYFQTFGVRLISGRFFNAGDNANSPQVIMVSEGFVHRYLQGTDPLSQRLLLSTIIPNKGLSPPTERQIVGVFHDIKDSRQLDGETQPQMMLPFGQSQLPFVSLSVRTEIDPNTMEKSIRSVVVTELPGSVLEHMQTMDQIFDTEIRDQRSGMVLFGGFAVLALFLSVMGIYGVMAFAVAQRNHEIGLRMALGAEKNDVASLILSDGIKLALIGAGIGLAGVYVLGRFMHSTLYGIQTIDFGSFVAVAAILIVAAVIASYIPARRSAKVDPMVALRQE